MSSPSPAGGAGQAAMSLRERKKAKTRRAIQDHALRLFAERGYDATTVESIAEAAEISPSTFFRYFPTKEDLLLRDEYDPMLAEAFRRQPSGLAPLPALRAAFRAVATEAGDRDLESALFRTRLAMTVPAARARSLENMLSMMDLLADAVAERTGADPSGPAVRVFAGAVIGALLPVLLAWVESGGETPVADLVDRALSLLEAGLPV
ncbi:acyl-CoA-like ligand-binding transcription factor [Sphaerisporangium aureirubrum]|uniref:TetR family transcriptional regulator n=1 Tax=Sphaerisporangium aureirubrum TaxID=1544736 RepID=A0ABW1NLV3_9ACTN